MDALAVAIGTNRKYAGVAPLGTSLTEAQATQLLAMSPNPIIATDADAAGRAAAARDYWILAGLAGRPRGVDLPDSADPADLLSSGRASALTESIENATALAQALLVDHLDAAPAEVLNAIKILASAPPELWAPGIQLIADQGGIPDALVKATLSPLVHAWNRQPFVAAGAFLATVHPAPLSKARRLHKGLDHAAANLIRARGNGSPRQRLPLR